MSRASALQHKPQTERGFTLVELMAVLAVLSILLLVAMTAYQDYAVRSQVSEGIRIAASHKSGVAQTFYTTGTLPGTNAAAGVEPATDYETDYVFSVGISSTPKGGTITISYKMLKLGADNLLQLVPTNNDGLLEWRCRAPVNNGIESSFLPSNCRG